MLHTCSLSLAHFHAAIYPTRRQLLYSESSTAPDVKRLCNANRNQTRGKPGGANYRLFIVHAADTRTCCWYVFRSIGGSRGKARGCPYMIKHCTSTQPPRRPLKPPNAPIGVSSHPLPSPCPRIPLLDAIFAHSAILALRDRSHLNKWLPLIKVPLHRKSWIRLCSANKLTLSCHRFLVSGPSQALFSFLSSL